MKVIRWDHHKPLLLKLRPIKGYYLPEFDIKTRKFAKEYYEERMILNKGYRNMAQYYDIPISNVERTLIDIGGTGRAVTRFKEHATACYDRLIEQNHLINYGSSTSPHDVSRYELYSRHFSRGAGGIAWVEDLDTETRIQTYHYYSFDPPSKSVGEAGYYITVGAHCFLLARAIIDPPVEKAANTMYSEGWRITFPANYTRWFVNAWYISGSYRSSAVGRRMRASDGSWYNIREQDTPAGSPDARIGSDNSTPSPTDYNLKSPIGSLSSQSHAIEIDTSVQECRIVRQGTYTPSTNVELGEIALFTRFYDVSGTAREFMVARGVWDPKIMLYANTTYTIGIALRFG